jgi:hypothetical protein
MEWWSLHAANRCIDAFLRHSSDVFHGHEAAESEATSMDGSHAGLLRTVFESNQSSPPKNRLPALCCMLLLTLPVGTCTGIDCAAPFLAPQITITAKPRYSILILSEI